MLYFFGSVAFLLLFLGDCNDWKWNRSVLRLCFPTGTLLLTGVTVAQAMAGTNFCPISVRWFFIGLAVVFLGLLLYTLFFALPVREAYVEQGGQRRVCTAGVYALCRHPGVLWFIGLYACLIPAAGLPLGAAVFYSGWNILLIIFEDCCVFPARLAGYREYRSTTPFLLPNRKSIRAFQKKAA